MSITVNEFVSELEQVWNALNWDRKFEHSTPTDDIAHVWHSYSAKEVAEAKQVLETLQEEEELENGTILIRSAHLGNWSSGEAIVICESELEGC